MNIEFENNNEKKVLNKAVISGLIIGIFIGVLGAVIYRLLTKAPEENEVKPTPTPVVEPTIEPTIEPTVEPTVKPTSNPTTTPTKTAKPVSNKSTFKYVEDNYALASYGYVYVKGYAEVKYNVPFCGVESPCNESNAYSVNNKVYFHITETDSQDFLKALELWTPDKNVIGMGCLKDNNITLISFADEFKSVKTNEDSVNEHLKYAKTIKLSSNVTNKIVSSNSNNIIKLKLEKKKLTQFNSFLEPCETEISNVELTN